VKRCRSLGVDVDRMIMLQEVRMGGATGGISVLFGQDDKGANR
jgi:hypothetical protein